MKIGKHTSAYIAALAPQGPLKKAAALAARLQLQREKNKKKTEFIDAFREFTSHNQQVNDND